MLDFYGDLMVFGRPFVKRFALCYRSVVLSCLSVCLSVTLVHCGQTVGRIKTKLGMQVGLGPGHTVRWGLRSPSPTGAQPPLPQFLAHICCGEMTRLIKMPLGMEVGLDPGDIVLDGDPAPSPKGDRAPSNFLPMSIVAKRLDRRRCHLERK